MREARPGPPTVTPPAPTRREAVRGVADDLRAAGVESPEVEAERLLCAGLGIGRSDLALAWGERLSPDEARRLARAAARRLAGEPLQHIEGTVEFRGLVLAADPRALIPRPETEELVDRIAAWARGRAGGAEGVRRVRRPGSEPPLAAALDIGTGSGAIALALAAEGIAARVVATDVSAPALAQARENLARLGPRLAERVELRLTPGPPWGGIAAAERFDLVVSNPPYVTDVELPALRPEVRDREPRAALAGGADGLEVIREIVTGAPPHLRPDGALFLEIGAGQGAAVRTLLEAGGWREIAVERDLAGRDRFVRGEPPPR